MTRKVIKVPAEEVIEDIVPQESREQPDIFDDWPELQKVTSEMDAPIEAFPDKGWIVFLKTKPSGRQYITLRLQGKDPETGKHIDVERSLGFFDPDEPERYEILSEMFHKKVPAIAPKSEGSQPTRASVLTSKVARIRPIGPSVEIKLGTLQWYTWVQNAAGFPGSLDDFINQSVDTLFRDHYKLELAVVNKQEENF